MGFEPRTLFAFNSCRRRRAAERGRALMERSARSRGPSFLGLIRLLTARKEDLVKALQKGQYIKHFQYGLGVITESDEERTSIDFDIHGIKKFVTSLMVVDPAEGTPPKRPRPKRGKKALTPPVPAAIAGAK
jgi:hypothetical protein